MRVRTLDSVLRALGRQAARELGVAAAAVTATVVCLTLAAHARIPLPFSPVPITLQTFFVLVAGALLGPRLGSLALATYLLLGAVGLPLFTTAWLGATAGYLVGFVVAGWLVGVLTRAGRPSLLRIVLAMVAASLLIYLCGAAWLAYVFRLDAGRALALGVAPYLVGDAVKLAAAAALVRRYRDKLRGMFR